ncbi:MAG TPA: RNA-binding protein, partial [Lactobacillus sp.]|nr:RNA-binding protein [Lactobacillus sp.]
GLKQLGLPRDAVSVQVVQENKNGFLGFMRKPAIVNLKPLEPPADPAPDPKTDHDPAGKS